MASSESPRKPNMGSEETHQIHVFFLPLMAQGHMIPTLDIARLFASRGVKVTIITTPLNAPFFSESIPKSRDLGFQFHVQIIEFPAQEVGLPQDCENVHKVHSKEMMVKFFKAIAMLQQPLEHLLQQIQPDCLIADSFLPWARDAAAKFDIPRLVFHGFGFFPLCAMEVMKLYEPHKNVSSETEPFIIPNLPDEIEVTRMQLSDYVKATIETDFTRLLLQARESEMKSYGVIVNSFYELEPAYADRYRKVLGRKAWHIGPAFLCNRDYEDQATIDDEHKCLKWLDSKTPNSVIYVCFGSLIRFPDSQLYEIAMGLEASDQQFIWVVRKGPKEEGIEEEWLPKGFEERMEGKGLIIRGWAPQVSILNHESVGGFVSHCGWNSTLEGVSAGVPMVTWPVYAEQFYNEKLITQILRIGVAVGSQKWEAVPGNSVKRDAIEMAVSRLMVGEETEEMRNRAKELRKVARRAVEEGGSSYSDLSALIEDLRLRGSKN